MSLHALVEKWRADADKVEVNSLEADSIGLRLASMLRQCADELESALAGGGEAVAWMHTRHMELGQTITLFSQGQENPFGEPGVDYSTEYTVTSEPLFTHPADGAELPEPVAVVGPTWLLAWTGTGPIAPLVRSHGMKIGDGLYTAGQMHQYVLDDRARRGG